MAPKGPRLRPLHIISLAEMAAMICLVASLIYLISFFGIAYIQSVISSHEDDEDFLLPSPVTPTPCPLCSAKESISVPAVDASDEDIIVSLVSGKTPSYILESKLGDYWRAVAIRREALRRMTGRPMEGLPIEGFDFASILGQCCELPIGYVRLPVGIDGLLALDGREFYVPMATTEGCLVASTNRGCNAILELGRTMSVVMNDWMMQAPVVRFPTAMRAAELGAGEL